MSIVIELFAGCGGMALGFEQAGFKNVMLVEKDKDCCNTLKINRPYWNVAQKDIANVDFTAYHPVVITGGFPCQSFSVIGNRKGLDEARGNLYQEYVRAITVCKPKMFVAENVPGLLSHDKGADD
jgi:DNA (cytosine-5)-methyltransferase 1